MKSQILVKKYTQGLVNALADEEEFNSVSEELSGFLTLLSSQKDLQNVLASPFVAAKKKKKIIRDVLAASSFSAKATRFIMLLHEHGRLQLLEAILRALPVCWNERNGVTTFEVSSVVPLSDTQKKSLKAQLERLEKRPVDLAYKIEPGLVAGISLKKGNVVYDASIKGHLSKLKEKICEG